MWSIVATTAISAGSTRGRPADGDGGDASERRQRGHVRPADTERQAMTVSDILRPEAARIVANINSKKRLMQALADCAAEVYGVSASDAFAALQEREQLGHTGVGRGVALPHARLANLDHVRGVFLRLDRPVDFDAIDRQPVDLVFALFAPEHRGVEHLKALALVARTMRDPAMRSKLRGNEDPATLYAVLTENTTTEAA